MDISRRENLWKIRRRCVRGSIDMIVLSLLGERPMCGYEIIESIYKRIQVLLSPGTVYPLLNSLRNRGLIVSRAEGKKRTYDLTGDGKDAMLRMSTEYAKIQSVFSVRFDVERDLQTLSQNPLGKQDDR